MSIIEAFCTIFLDTFFNSFDVIEFFASFRACQITYMEMSVDIIHIAETSCMHHFYPSGTAGTVRCGDPVSRVLGCADFKRPGSR